MTRHARLALAFLGLAAASLWLPIAAITYLPGWHEASCDWHKRCAAYDHGLREPAAHRRIAELRAFMTHRAGLEPLHWTGKERAHLAEVRTMLDRGAVLALLGALVFLHAGARDRAAVARAAMLLIGACVIVLPFFGTFWRDVFHPLLFNNLMWKNTPADTSYWVMPRVYFQYCTALVIGVATLLCALARYQALGQVRAQGDTAG